MSFWVTTKRVTRYGIAGFVRNGFVSLAAVLIMTITLSVVTGLIIASAALNSTLTELTNKVDVTVYFQLNATDEQIADIRRSLEGLPEVASVNYVTREQALADFRERHKNDQLTLQALDELGDNPFGASLEIRAKETSQYENIATYLNAQQEAQTAVGASIDKVNFFQNKTAIDRLTAIIDTSRNLGLAVALGANQALNSRNLLLYGNADFFLKKPFLNKPAVGSFEAPESPCEGFPAVSPQHKAGL